MAARCLGHVLPRWPIRVPFAADRLTHDLAVVEAYQADPDVHHGPVPARTGWELLAALDRLQQSPLDLSTPLCILHGSDDAVADPVGSRWLVDRWGASDRTLKVYEGLYHEVLNEAPPVRCRVLNDLADWLRQHIEAP